MKTTLIEPIKSVELFSPMSAAPDDIEKRVEERTRELTASLSLLNATLDSAVEGILVFQISGEVVYYNSKFVAMWGIPADVLEKRDHLETVNFIAAQVKNSEQFLRRITRPQAQPEAGGFDVIDLQDGRTFECYIQPRQITDQWAGMVLNFRDITKQKEAEDKLTEERNLLRTLIDNLPDYVYAKDVKGRFVIANIAVARQLGFSTPNEVIGKSDFDLFPQELAARYYADEQEIIKSGKGLYNHGGPTVDASKEEKNRWVLTSKVALRDTQGEITGFIGIGCDITAIKEAEAKLDLVHKQLLDTSRQAGMAEVATSVLHNVGNVLNSVNVASSCVADSLKKSKAANLSKVVALLREHETDLGDYITNDAKGKQLPGYLAQLAEHLAGEQTVVLDELALLQKNIEHIKDIVAMQQSYAKTSGVKELLPVVNLVEDAFRMNTGAMERHHINVVREYSETPPVSVEKHKVLQILVNLIRNAKYACDDSGRTDKQIILRVANGDGRIKISVIDNGVGIPAENMTRIFNHGFTTRKDGHGFGLHSGSLAAKEIGGNLIAFSEGSGRGATFTLELPLQPTKAGV
ncbi:MAG TPA: PAS domain-containing sensor histidine kinase [Verrucomicrobiae bacterium]